MFVSNQITTTHSFSIDPVTGEFTAGQTVTATGSLSLPLPLSEVLQLELLDEVDARPLFTTSFQLNQGGPEAFSFVIPTTLR